MKVLTDSFGRRMSTLRISVTDRCNYRCVYCGPQAESPRESAALSCEEVAAVARAAVGLGIRRLRITGGEPLLRADIVGLVRLLSGIRGVGDLAMSTNGSLLGPELAQALARAGLRRVNISLDSLDGGRFSRITGGGRLEDVLRGVDSALEAGLVPVKINMVVFEDTTEADLERMRRFCSGRGLQLQTISRYDINDRSASLDHSCHRPPSCSDCGRLRLAVDGCLRPCLFSDRSVRVDLSDVEGSIRAAAAMKPRRGGVCSSRAISLIGG